MSAGLVWLWTVAIIALLYGLLTGAELNKLERRVQKLEKNHR